jgi:hypothetical protein
MTPSSLVRVGLAVNVRERRREKIKANGHSEVIVPERFYFILKMETAKRLYSVTSQKGKGRISTESHSLHMFHQAIIQAATIS